MYCISLTQINHLFDIVHTFEHIPILEHTNDMPFQDFSNGDSLSKVKKMIEQITGEQIKVDLIVELKKEI